MRQVRADDWQRLVVPSLFNREIVQQIGESTVNHFNSEVSNNDTGSANTLYLLQAGSFRQLADADRRRAELLLLGLEPNIEETSGDNGRWYRVYVGPFDSRAKVSRARSLTAGQNIDTLLLKRDKP